MAIDFALAREWNLSNVFVTTGKENMVKSPLNAVNTIISGHEKFQTLIWSDNNLAG